MTAIDRYLLTFLVNALWQSPLVAAVAALACRAMRNSPAQHRHLVWVAALAAQLLLPLASLQAPHRDVPVLAIPQRSLPANAFVAAASGAAPAPAVREVPVASKVAGGLLGGYLLFVAFRLCLLVRAVVRTARIRRAAGPEAGLAVERAWARCAAAFGIRAELRTSRTVAGPLTAGRTIILPAGLLAEPSDHAAGDGDLA